MGASSASTVRGDGGWDRHVLDTSARATYEVADEVLTWSWRALSGHAPQIRLPDLEPSQH
jgi:hypothetical protein